MLAEHAARTIVTDGWANQSDGHVDAPTGAFALIILEPAEVDADFLATWDLTSADVTPGYYLEQQDQQGNTSVTEFDTEWEARAAYTALEQQYQEWAEA